MLEREPRRADLRAGRAPLAGSRRRDPMERRSVSGNGQEGSDDAPTYGSLFAGIGGIDIGLERAGWRPLWLVEYDRDAAALLRKRWPDVPIYGDIRSVDFGAIERVDLVAGGFPCQPV